MFISTFTPVRSVAFSDGITAINSDVNSVFSAICHYSVCFLLIVSVLPVRIGRALLATAWFAKVNLTFPITNLELSVIGSPFLFRHFSV